MFGSSCSPFVQPAGSVVAIGASAIGHSPPSWSDWVLERYGQKSTESESVMPPGQLASAAALPLTGFSGIGGLNVVAEGATVSGHTAGPGVGSVSVPVRTPHQAFVAVTGVVLLLPRPLSVVLRTPNALSATLLCITDVAEAPPSRPPA